MKIESEQESKRRKANGTFEALEHEFSQRNFPLKFLARNSYGQTVLVSLAHFKTSERTLRSQTATTLLGLIWTFNRSLGLIHVVPTMFAGEKYSVNFLK